VKLISIQNTLASLFLIFVASCTEKDPLPLSNASFIVVTDAPEIHQEVKFENLSVNASSYEWNFGDVSPGSSEISPIHIFEESKSYTVTLSAFTEDGQVSTVEEEIVVGERYLTGMYIININMKNAQGKPWDDDGSGPDVLMQFGPVSYTSDEQIQGFFVDSLNVGYFKTPIGISIFDLLPIDYKLTNEDFFLRLEEVDTVNNKPIYTTMTERRFNPLAVDQDEITEIIRENGEGDLTVPLFVQDQYQFFLEFVIR
jgi:PKD repeat protein